MKKKSVKILALFMAVLMAFSTGTSVSAISENALTKTAGVLDCILDTLIDVILDGLIDCLMKADGLLRKYPTADEFLSQNDTAFYPGTQGTLIGNAWKLGYAGASVIPVAWRRNAGGEQDDNGMNLNKNYYFGGYFGSKVDKIYDDETVNLAILSAGTDKNHNGVEDILIFASLDNIGMSNGNVRKVRKAVAQKLALCGVENDDILAFEFTCTHAHTVIEALGMSLDNVFFVAMKNHFFFRRDTSVNKELFSSICEKTAESAVQAYKNRKSGTLSFFETENLTEYMSRNAVNFDGEETVAHDKLKYGAGCQDSLACWYFESEDGEKTVLANSGMHPTFAGRSSKRVCADFTYWFNQAMQDQGYHFVFLQGSQAATAVSDCYTKQGEQWAESKTLSKEAWVQRYGQKYADEHYAEEQDYFAMKAVGYSLSQAIVDAIETKTALNPTVNVKMKQVAFPLDYGIMYLGGVSGVFGYNMVRTKGTETGYSVITEIGYLTLGDEVAMLLLPGEVSPALTFGKAEGYEGEASWSGEGSWSGKTWDYKTLEQIAKEALGENMKVCALGLANDEVGYIMPDTDCARNFLSKSILGGMGERFGRASNEELMGSSSHAGSALVNAYAELFGVTAK